jgi:hypothetical protein
VNGLPERGGRGLGRVAHDDPGRGPGRHRVELAQERLVGRTP